MRRGQATENHGRAATAAAAPTREQTADEGTGASASVVGDEAEASPSRRRKGSAASAETRHGNFAGISNGKYDLQCFRCLQRPPTHTAFVYVSELMR